MRTQWEESVFILYILKIEISLLYSHFTYDESKVEQTLSRNKYNKQLINGISNNCNFFNCRQLWNSWCTMLEIWPMCSLSSQWELVSIGLFSSKWVNFRISPEFQLWITGNCFNNRTTFVRGHFCSSSSRQLLSSPPIGEPLVEDAPVSRGFFLWLELCPESLVWLLF